MRYYMAQVVVAIPEKYADEWSEDNDELFAICDAIGLDSEELPGVPHSHLVSFREIVEDDFDALKYTLIDEVGGV